MTRRKNGTDDRLRLEEKEEVKLTPEEIQKAWEDLEANKKKWRKEMQERNVTTYSTVYTPLQGL